MNRHALTLAERIEEVETRIAERQHRLKLRMYDTHQSARALALSRRTLFIVAGAGLLLTSMMLLRPATAAKSGGVGGVLIAAALAFLRRRYGSPLALGWRLLNQRRQHSRRLPGR
jgi:hypothetical protein